ncbi:MAG: MarR family transcriptional regulator [Anaerolineales bacterium]|jgi:DNA-binding MarR family transcriptional regulator
MCPVSQPPASADAVKLLQRIVRLRSRFKVVAPENFAALRKQIHESKPSGKEAGIEDAGLFYTAGSVFFRYEGPITMGELSRDLEVPLSTATRTMDWLVTNGYAQRLPDPKDRRVVRVELTDQGRETFQTISTFMLARVEQAMSPLNASERQTFICLLNKVLDAFEQFG